MTSVRISDDIFHEAQAYGHVFSRSAPKQIEYWAKLGKIVEDNPDLTYEDIKSILLSLEEKKRGDVDSYGFS